MKKLLTSRTDTLENMDELLNTVYLLSKEETQDQCIDFIFEYIDQSFHDERFSEIDIFLEKINVNKLIPSIIVAVLTITSHADDKLYRRNFFKEKAKEFLSKNESTKDRLDFLLRNL